MSFKKEEKMFDGHFTPKEANKRLPYIKRIVEDILKKGQRLQALLKNPSTPPMEKECEDLEREINRHMRELEEIGCFFKDWNFEIGLVDFPAVIDGEEVLLCWKSDEPEVLWYHSMEDGFSGRKPIPEYWLIEGEDLFKENS